MKEKLGDGLLLGLQRGRSRRGGGGARRRHPLLILRRTPSRMWWIWWGKVSSSSIAWLGRKKGRERRLLCEREQGGEGASGEVEVG
jgi:hypothetical protein